jgi:hypothetical protein
MVYETCSGRIKKKRLIRATIRSNRSRLRNNLRKHLQNRPVL